MSQRISIYITVKSIILLLAAVAVVWLIINFSSILLMLFLGSLLAVAITPLVERLVVWHIPRTLAILLIYLALLGIAGMAVGILVPVLIDQIGQLRTSLPATAQQLFALPQRWLGAYFPAPGNPGNLAQQLSDGLGSLVGNVGGLLVTLGGALTTIFFNALLVLVVGFFLAVDARFAGRFIKRFFPPHYRPAASRLATEIGARLGHWVRAQLLVCLFYGIAFGIGLGVIGMPYAFALGLAAAVLELIPYVGGAIVTGIAMLVALSISPWLTLGVLVVYMIVAAVESNVLYPKVVGDSVGVHPLVIIIALFIGAEARGVMGALLAVPCTVVLQVLFEQFYRFDEPDAAAVEVPTIERERPRPAPAPPPVIRQGNSYETASAPREE
jgi:predicted PurR-regulated permease PerM